MRQTLGRLLGDHQGGRAEPGPAPNGVPKSLIALYRLGATSEQLDAYAKLHRFDRTRLPPPASPGHVVRNDWRTALGDPLMEQAYRAYFEAELVRLGRDAMLREYLPDLMEGCGGAGFRPMVRLALGLQQDDDSEVVMALAGWATAYLGLGHGRRPQTGEDDPRGVLDRLRRQFRGSLDCRDAALAVAMPVVCEVSAFQGVLHWLDPNGAGLAKMADAALAVFVGVGNEKALQIVAATHALRVLCPWFYDPTPALRFYWQAVAAAYLVMGAPPLPPPQTLAETAKEVAPPWPALRQAAIASLDDAVIQAVYCCGEEEQATGNPLYRMAAARFVARSR